MVPELRARVIDQTGTLDATQRAALEAKLAAFEQSAGPQIVVLLVPWYTAASFYYGTYEDQYAWTVSAAFLSGPVVAGVEIFLYLSLILAFVVSLGYLLVQYGKCTPEGVTADVVARQLSEEEIKPRLSKRARFLVYVVFLSVNVIFVLSVNVAFVYVALYESNTALLLAQLFLSLFKLFWNNFCSKNLLRWTGKRIAKSVEVTESVYGAEFHFVQLLVSLINNIAIPCIVVAVISPNCLYNVFVPAPEVNASYRFDSCILHGLIDGKCLNSETEIGTTSYNPPFVYSYQCSSSIVTYYAPAFVFLCITATFVTPLSQFVAMRAARDERLPPRVRSALEYCVPKILLPLDLTEQTTQSAYFDANRVAILLFSYFGLLMTFGAVFPPLAVAFAVTICSTTFFIKLKLGSFLGSAVELKAVQLVEALNSECRRLAQLSVLGPSVWLIVTFSCWFYTLFLFDTLGDAMGFRKSFWILIVVPLMPAFLYVLYCMMVRFVGRSEALDAQSVSETTLSPLSRQVSGSAHVELSDVYSRPSESV